MLRKLLLSLRHAKTLSLLLVNFHDVTGVEFSIGEFRAK